MIRNSFLKKQLKKVKNKEEIEKFNKILNSLENISLFDTQIVAANLIKDGSIIEMKTGEGKTLVAILSSYLNILNNKKTFIITANDYLAKRDAEYSKKILSSLGVNNIYYINSLDNNEEKKYKYKNANIIYTTMDNLIFDFLRSKTNYTDNYFKNLDSIILDEADLMLIDNAMNASYLTGNSTNLKKYYQLFDKIAKKSKKDLHFKIAKNNIILNAKGYELIEESLIEKNIIKEINELYYPENIDFINQYKNALKANYLLELNNDYAVINNEIKTIDTKTGRINYSGQLGNGLQQAVEAYNRVSITTEKELTAMLTIQSFLKKFKTLSGMTGTIYEDKKEIEETYNTNVYKIPTNKEIRRIDNNDLFFHNKETKTEFLVKRVKKINKKGQPILIGTINENDAIEISKKLEKNNIKHNILISSEKASIREKESEANIIASAGKKGSVVISNKIAGRGTDIVLGGDRNLFTSYNDWEKEYNNVNDLGGLYIIGFERNLTRRYDNQLIGRSGRQGDNGQSVFLISADDKLIKTFDTGKLKMLLESLKVKQNAIENKYISNAIKRIQKNIENANYDQRKRTYIFDKINDEYRTLFYDIRDKIIESKNINKFLLNLLSDYIEIYIKDNLKDSFYNKNNIENIKSNLEHIHLDINLENFLNNFDNIEVAKEKLRKKVINHVEEIILKNNQKNNLIFQKLSKRLLLEILYKNWALQISNLESLKQKSSVRSFAQKSPIDEYKKEISIEFDIMIFNSIKEIYFSFIPYFINFDKKINDENKKDFINNQKEILLTGISPILGVGF
tara:strand:+ start:54218 stop:56605 length:2388 start_codon:yes stop_codon:yes gene_type:complete